MKYIIKEGGDICCVGDDLLSLGPVEQQRASHILPVNPVKRAAFRLLRLMFGERGKVAAWTRTWRGPWQGIIIGSKRSFIHPSRRVVLAWERDVLERNL